MALTKKEVEHVARLGRLALTEDEKENFTVQLGHILQYVEKLKELKIAGAEEPANPFFQKTVWR